MWRANGTNELYVYDQGRLPGACGTRSPTSITFTTGRWYAITIYVKLNTTATAADGVAGLYIDGQLARQETGICFRAETTSSSRINQIFFSTFFGGNESKRLYCEQNPGTSPYCTNPDPFPGVSWVPANISYRESSGGRSARRLAEAPPGRAKERVPVEPVRGLRVAGTSLRPSASGGVGLGLEPGDAGLTLRSLPLVRMRRGLRPRKGLAQAVRRARGEPGAFPLHPVAHRVPYLPHAVRCVDGELVSGQGLPRRLRQKRGHVLDVDVVRQEHGGHPLVRRERDRRTIVVGFGGPQHAADDLVERGRWHPWPLARGGEAWEPGQQPVGAAAHFLDTERVLRACVGEHRRLVGDRRPRVRAKPRVAAKGEAPRLARPAVDDRVRRMRLGRGHEPRPEERKTESDMSHDRA
jgi:polysaccharide lyase-like protein